MDWVPRNWSEWSSNRQDNTTSVSNDGKVIVASIRDSAWNVVDLSTLPMMAFDSRVKLITAFYPEYLQKIDEKVRNLLTSFKVDDENFSVECKQAVRERTETIIWDNTYTNNPVCWLSWWDRLAHLLWRYWGFWNTSRTEQYEMIGSIQKSLTKISMEVAALCFYNAWYKEKWIYLVWLANADSVFE